MLRRILKTAFATQQSMMIASAIWHSWVRFHHLVAASKAIVGSMVQLLACGGGDAIGHLEACCSGDRWTA
jgi:hypothetical protein